MEGLRGHMSGLGIPTYVVDSPHGGGKIPLMPNYLVSASDDAVILRNFEGMLVRYQAEDKPLTVRKTKTRGVSSLLQGTESAIIPQKSERLERRRLTVISDHDRDDKEGGCLGPHVEPAPKKSSRPHTGHAKRGGRRRSRLPHGLAKDKVTG
jgi:lysine 2,3-aminomutase